MWEAYWRVRHDPFLGTTRTYVPLPAHEEALARLCHGVAHAERLLVLRGAQGLGKTVVLSRTAAEMRAPSRRFVGLAPPAAPEDLFRGLAEALGGRTSGRTAASPWLAFTESLRIARLQRRQVVVVLDDADDLFETELRRDLDRLLRAIPHRREGLTILAALRGASRPPQTAHSLQASLSRLSYSECSTYVNVKVAAAGRPEPAFDPSAEVELYERSEGVPAALDRLATLALMAGALQGVARVDRSIVEGIASEFLADAGPVPSLDFA